MNLRLRNWIFPVAALVAWTIVIGLGAIAAFSLPTSAERQAEREKLRQLDPAVRRQIQQAYERFRNLDPQEKAQLHELHASLEAHPRQAELRRIMSAYYDWLRTVAPYERFELRRLPVEKRLARVQQLHEEQARWRAGVEAMRASFQREWFRRLFPPGLTKEDVEAIGGFCEELADKHVDRFLALVPEEFRAQLRAEWQANKNNPTRKREVLGWLWLRWQLDHPDKLPPLVEEEREQLLSRLTPASRAKLVAMPPGDQERIIARAMRFLAVNYFASKAIEGPPPIISEQELAGFLEQTMSAERREELFRLSPAERRGRLWFEFLRSRWRELAEGPPPGGGPAWSRPRFPGGPPGMSPPAPGLGPGVPPGGFGPGRPRRSVEGPSQEFRAPAPGPDSPPDFRPSPPGEPPQKPGQSPGYPGESAGTNEAESASLR